MNAHLWVLCGPTGVGKTALAHALSARMQSLGEPHSLVNMDRIQMIQGADIGSAKPTLQEQRQHPYLFIDRVAPGQEYTAADFLRELETAVQAAPPPHTWLVVGGTPFYLRALLTGIWDAPPTPHDLRAELESLSSEALWNRLMTLAPDRAHSLHPNDRYRVIRAIAVHASHASPAVRRYLPHATFSVLSLALDQEPSEQRLLERIRRMLSAGWIEEVQALQRTASTAQRTSAPASHPLTAVGYQQVAAYLAGKHPPGRSPVTDLEGLAREILLAHRQMARKQRQFFAQLAQSVPSDRATFTTLPAPQNSSELANAAVDLHQQITSLRPIGV